MDLEPVEWIWYIPAFGGERERHDRGEVPDPCMVEIRSPTYGSYLALIAARGADGVAPLAAKRAYFLAHVRGIQNLTLAGEPILDGAALWTRIEADQVEAELVFELMLALDSRSALRAGLKKNLRSGSGSPVSPRRPDGTVETAEPAVST